ncbi:DUF3040 domain-containing protein [Streptomyces sp. Act143]|uniref:DUF3040 domain-containing protein n=1 Tax=Streptomyces sp. Act143 TaxID=2200760 RepID=UPI00215AC3C8|nr:DUF3040 domain-containing protein [Streptomyces sp. Act143]
MNERSDPDDVVLSPHERLALSRMEAELSADRRLTRRMRRQVRRRAHRLVRPGARRPVSRRWLPLSTAALLSASVFLVVMGVRTSEPAVLWCFAVLWPLTLLQGFRLLCRATEDGTDAGPGAAGPGTPWR